MSLLSELKRRNVLRVGAAYIVVAWLLIQVAETIFPLYGFGDTPARIVTTVLAIGLIPILVFAWAFELTPEGIRRDEEVDRSQSIQTGKRLDRVIMMALALGLAYFAFDRFVLDPDREAKLASQKAVEIEKAREAGRTEAFVESFGDQSIAVLPFADMSPDGDQAYLSDGLAEELLNLLAQIRELRVISRSSAFSFKSREIGIPEIAERLNVRHILEGSVRKAGNKIRVTAQLIDARSDTHLWSQTYDRDLGDIFAIQDEIAGAIVEQLKLALVTPLTSHSETDPETYDLYLRAQHAFRTRTPEGNAEAQQLLQRALVLDSNYAPAWSALGQAYLGDQVVRPMLPEESVPLARKAAETALQLDPNDWGAHRLLINIALDGRDFQAAAHHLETLMASGRLDPEIVNVASSVAKILGHLDDAMSLASYAVARDPLVANYHVSQGILYYYSGEVDEALARFEYALALNPDLAVAHAWLAAMYLLQDRYQEALMEIAKEKWPAVRLMVYSLIYYDLGEVEKSDEAKSELLQLPVAMVGYAPLVVFAYRGEIEAGLDWLEQNAGQMNFPSLAEGNVSPVAEPLRKDPRYEAVMRTLGLSKEQLASIEFEVNLPE